MLYFGIFRLEFEKVTVVFEIDSLNLSKSKVWCKMKIHKFGIKYTGNGYIWAGG